MHDCINWDGKTAKKFGPSITVNGRARSLRRILWEQINGKPLEPNEKLKAKNSSCFFHCTNLNHFEVVQIDPYNIAEAA